MGDIIVLVIIIAIVALAVGKLRKDKKNGVKCSGCAQAKTCPSNIKK